MDTISLRLPLKDEYITSVRLTVGGLCAVMDFDVDTTEDYKVCVTESLLILKRCGYKSVQVAFTLGETLKTKLSAEDKSGDKETGEDDISFALLNALIGNATFLKDSDGDVYSIAFEG